jgi:dihydrofolate reductase
MRKIVVFNLVTLDGYFAGADGNIDWHNVDDEFNQFAIEQTAEFGGIIFGRTTYKIFEDYWPTALKDPKTSDDDRKVAQIIDDTWKIVFSKSLKEVSWKNSQLYFEIDPEEVKRWKQYDGKDIAIFGSGTVVQQFANLGLVDEYRLLVNPVILGAGKPMFENVKDMHKLKLINTRNFKNGNVLLIYEPAK